MYTLSPGSFQWRVKAINNSYETGFVTYSFEIDSSNDLSGETLQLLLPFNHDTTNKVQMNFKWLALYNATHYNLELYYESNLILVESTTDDNMNLSMDAGEGDYTWKVQAVNQVSETNFSERHLFLDTDITFTTGLIITCK
ncbi:MAG: hypothetical protein U5Q03_18070 [Bacteroidota bacterium]|nr:hypothetical protein [Bacteroidota bacterium]